MQVPAKVDAKAAKRRKNKDRCSPGAFRLVAAGGQDYDSLVKGCSRIRPVFSFGRDRKILRTYANELLSLVHLRTLATQDDHFSCGFSCIITALLFLHLSRENRHFYLFAVSPLCMCL
jgi:hypothetical protein